MKHDEMHKDGLKFNIKIPLFHIAPRTLSVLLNFYQKNNIVIFCKAVYYSQKYTAC